MNKYPLFESKYYKVSLYEQGQLYLARQVVALKSSRRSLSEVTKDEWIDFGDVVAKVEGTVEKVFGAEYFNWGCFMNDAFKSKNPEPRVHWHVRPRYRNPVDFVGRKFVDKAFGSQFLRKDEEIILEEKQLKEIQDHLIRAYATL